MVTAVLFWFLPALFAADPNQKEDDFFNDPSKVFELEEDELADLPPLPNQNKPVPDIKRNLGKKNSAKTEASGKNTNAKVYALRPGQKGPVQNEVVTQLPAPVRVNNTKKSTLIPPMGLLAPVAASQPAQQARAPVSVLPPADTNNILFLPDVPSEPTQPPPTPYPGATAAMAPQAAPPAGIFPQAYSPAYSQYPATAPAYNPHFAGANPGQASTPNLAAPQTLPLVLAPSFFGNANAASPAFTAGYPSRGLAFTAPAATEKLPVPPSTPMVPMPGVPDVAIILANNQFYPSRIKLKDGMQTRLIFTTTNKKPAALVIERLQIQRWIAKEEEKPSTENERIRFEVSREVTSSRVTEVILDPKTGSYSFHDAMSGATGEIIVE